MGNNVVMEGKVKKISTENLKAFLVKNQRQMGNIKLQMVVLAELLKRDLFENNSNVI